MKRNFTKKVLSILMATVMMITVVPMNAITAFSAEDSTIKGAMETVYRNATASNGRKTVLNQNWKFNMTTADCYTTAYNDSSWSGVSLPHDFSIYQNFTTSGEAESGFLPGGTGWYRKKLVLPANQNGKRFELNFDGSYMHTYVYVNGSYVGENHYGYNSFAFDITDKLTCDGSTENVIAVKVVHNTPSSRWYSGSGLYRSVTLVTTDPVHIAHNGLTITTPNIALGLGTVNAVAKVQNQSSSSANVTVKATIYEKGSDSALVNATSSATVNANSTSNVLVAPVVSNPKKWDLDNPNLYTAKIEVIKDDSIVDTYEDTFGFRYFSWSRTNGFSLNGTRVQLQGVCMHHDQGALGSAAYYDAMYRQMANMKNMGVNAIRATHNPYSEDFYKICDELGILVIEELFDGWSGAKNGNSNDFSGYWNTALTSNNTIIGGSTSLTWPHFVMNETVQRDINRASVFMWSLGNEVFEGYNTSSSAQSAYTTIAGQLKTWIKEDDPVRHFTIGDNHIKGNETAYVNVDAALKDDKFILGLNYVTDSEIQSIYNNYTYTLYGSETSSAVNSRDRYMSQAGQSNIDGNRHLTSFDTSAVGWGHTAHDSMYYTYSKSFYGGEFIWTGWDYIGEPTPWNGTGSGQASGGNGATPNSSYFGIVDTAGFEKDTYYFYRSQWGDNVGTTTNLVTAWDSDNYMTSNGKVPVVLYSNAYKVEIYRNGTLMGTATRNDQTVSGSNVKYHTYSCASNNDACTTSSPSGSASLYATFNIAYEAGTLSTKSYDKAGNLINASNIQGRHTVNTPGDVAKIVMTKDKEEITADGQSLAYFTVDLTDASGNRDTMSSKLIKFDITGNGEIMGLDNGDQATTQKYQQSSVIDVNNRTTAQIYGYAGKALCIVRSTNEAGSFTVTASSPTSEFASVSQTVNTVASDDVEGGEFNNGDISSYSLIRNYTVKKGTAPTFDTTATANVVGGDEPVNGTITWPTVDSSKYNTVGDYTVNGTVNFGDKGNFAVTCTLHVVDGIAGVQNIAVQTMKGVAPTLPDVVNGLTATGEVAGQFPVEWNTKEATEFATVGNIVEVAGNATDFDGTKIPVKAFVRVVEPNVSTSSDITDTAYISDSINKNEKDTSLNALRDGNITTEAWTNEANATASDIQYRWDTAVLLSSLDIAYNIGDKAIGDKACAPEDVDIQYSLNGTDFTSIGYTGPLSIKAGELLHYQLDETINPIAIRVVFTQQKRTTGECCVAVNEVKLNTETKSLPEASDSADLSSILVKGVAITGFSADKLNYSSIVLAKSDAVTATANGNVAITVIKNETNAVIVTLSENGEETKKYTVGNVVIPDVTTEVYKFDFKNSTPTTLETGSSLKTLTDNAGHTLNYMLWQASSVTTGQYLKIQDAFINTPSTIDTGIKGDCWNVVYKYNKTTADKPNATLIGLGTTGGSGSMADLIYITADGYVETGFTNTSSNQSTSVGKSLYDTSASSPEILDIGYDNGVVTVKYNDETVFTKDISANETLNNKFKNGVGSFFIGANKYVSAGGTYSDTSHNSSGQAAYIQKIYDLTGTTTIKGSGGEVVEFESENIAPKATVTSNVSDSLTPLTDGNKEYSSSNRVINWNVRSQGQMTVTFTWDKVYTLDYTNVDFYSEGWGTFPPKQFDIYVSTDGTTFSTSPIMSYTNDGSNMPSVSSSANVYEKKYEFPVNTKAKAVKMVATVRDGSISSGKYATGFAEIEIFNKEQKAPVTPVEPEEPEETEYVADTTAIDSAMSAFETKVNSGVYYKNIKPAYTAYVECQKARDAAKYGRDENVDLEAKAQDLTTKTNALAVWTAPTYNASTRFSSGDVPINGTFGNALSLVANDDRHFNTITKNSTYITMFCHDGVYVYDGENATEIPLMCLTAPQNAKRYIMGIFPKTALPTGVSLKDDWHSVINNSARIYSGSWNNNLRIANRDNVTNVYVYNSSTYSYYQNSNKFVVSDGFFTSNNVIYKKIDFPSDWGVHQGSATNSGWKETVGGFNPSVYVINYKPVKDYLKNSANTNVISNISKYKEGGAADVINNFNNIGTISLSSLTTSTITNALNSDMLNLQTAIYYLSQNTSNQDSSAYASLRTALDSAPAITGKNCYAIDKVEAYKTARANAIKAMKDVGASGYVGSNISALATALDDANAEMKASDGAHDYSAGIYNPTENEITYTCTTNAEHTLVVDAGTYSAVVEELQANLAEAKFKTQAIKNCLAEISENGYFGLINGTSVSKVVTQDEMDNIIEAIATLKTELNERVNIKRFDISYVYQKNEEKMSNGIAVDSRYGDSRYGDWLSESYYDLGKNENVYKWTITDTDANVTTKTTNKSTGLNVRADRNMELACYISDGSEVAQDNQHKVTFVSKAGKIAGVEFLDANTILTVDGDTVKVIQGNESNVVFKAPKIPFYQVMGFKVGSTSYVTSNTISVTRDLIIAPVYEPQSTFSIYTFGTNAASVTINEASHHGERSAYQANWDEKIRLDSKNPNGVYWYINDKLVGFGRTYSFRATCNSVITVSTETVNSPPVAFLSYFNYDVELNRVTAVVNFYSERGTVTSAGVILSTKDSTEENVKANGKKFDSTNFTDNKNQVRISVSRTVNTAFNMYAVPYVVVNGTDYYYGDMVTLNYIPA